MFNKAAFSGFSVQDQAQTKNFYQKVLGLPVKDTGMGLQIQFENGHSVFLYEKDDHLPATFTVLNFPVDNIDEAVEALIAAGATMERYDSMPAAQDEKGILRGKSNNRGPDIAWFKDPSGNILAVLEN